MNNLKEKIDTLDLFIKFFKEKNNFVLEKQASITKLKLSDLLELTQKGNILNQGQNAVLTICLKDYDNLLMQIQNYTLKEEKVLH